jgi:hypothetical protein
MAFVTSTLSAGGRPLRLLDRFAAIGCVRGLVDMFPSLLQN